MKIQTFNLLLILFSSSVLLFLGITSIAKKNYKKKLNKNLSFIGIVLLSTTTIILNSFLFFNNNQNNIKENVRTYTYKPINREEKQEFTKEAALNSLINMLKSFKEDPSKSSSLQERFEKITSNNGKITDYVSDESLSYIHLTDTMKTDNVNTTTSLTVLGVLNILEQTGNLNLDTKITNVEEFIYIDEHTKTAQIPLDIFTASSTAMSFEMVYVDNQWKFAPYSFIQSVQLSDQIQNSLKNNTEN